MKRSTLLLAIMATGLLASPARAQFNLAWHDCNGLPNAAQNVDYACDGSRDGNPFRLIVTFVAPSDLAQFVGVQVGVGMRTSQPVLPDWWRVGIGECRDGGIVFPGSRTGIGTGSTGACVDPWASGNTGGGLQWLSETAYACELHPMVGPTCYDYPASAFGTLRVAYARDTAVPLQGGQRYFVAPILIDPANGPVDCAGCDMPACLYVRSVELFQVAGQVAPQQDTYLLYTSNERTYVTWQGGGVPGSACPLEVPVKRATWGAIKAIYR